MSGKCQVVIVCMCQIVSGHHMSVHVKKLLIVRVNECQMLGSVRVTCVMKCQGVSSCDSTYTSGIFKE